MFGHADWWCVLRRERSIFAVSFSPNYYIYIYIYTLYSLSEYLTKLLRPRHFLTLQELNLDLACWPIRILNTLSPWLHCPVSIKPVQDLSFVKPNVGQQHEASRHRAHCALMRIKHKPDFGLEISSSTFGSYSYRLSEENAVTMATGHRRPLFQFHNMWKWIWPFPKLERCTTWNGFKNTKGKRTSQV